MTQGSDAGEWRRRRRDVTRAVMALPTVREKEHTLSDRGCQWATEESKTADEEGLLSVTFSDYLLKCELSPVLI